MSATLTSLVPSKPPIRIFSNLIYTQNIVYSDQAVYHFKKRKELYGIEETVKVTLCGTLDLTARVSCLQRRGGHILATISAE